MVTRTHRSFEIDTDSTGKNKISVKINETPGVSAENLSLATWGSSYVLANQLHRWKDDAQLAISKQMAQDIPVLELGAGTSLVGISAAVIWQTSAVVTDLPTIVPGLAQNIAANLGLREQCRACFDCGSLDWSQPENLIIHPGNTVTKSPPAKARIIVAADTVYAEDHPSLLTATIKTWLAPGPDSRAILCYVLRHSYIDIIRDLWASLEDAGLECIEEGQQDADPDTWDDVAPFEWCVWRWKQ